MLFLLVDQSTLKINKNVSMTSLLISEFKCAKFINEQVPAEI